MMIKRWLTGLLAVCMLLSLVGCGEKKKEETEETEKTASSGLLPYGLEFGMSFIDAYGVHDQIPVMEPAEANDGWFAGIEYVDEAEVKTFFGIPSEVYLPNPGLAYSFNENKELYEFYVLCDGLNEGDAETAISTISQYYSLKTGAPPTYDESESGITAVIETFKVGVTVSITPSESGFQLLVSVHSFEYQLTA